MKKTLLLSACALVLSSCGIDYQGSTKLLFEGRVIDPDGNALKGIPVYASISDGDATDYIGIDETDNNGNYKMIFPGAKEEVWLAVHINYEDYKPAESEWSSTTIFNIPQEQIENSDYLINLGNTSLYQSANSVNLHVDYIQDGNPDFYPDKIMLTGFVDGNRIDYNFSSVRGFAIAPAYYVENNFRVAKNQVLTLQYTYQDDVIHEVQIPVGEEELTYTLAF